MQVETESEDGSNRRGKGERKNEGDAKKKCLPLIIFFPISDFKKIYVLSNNPNIGFKSDTRLTAEAGGLSLKYCNGYRLPSPAA